MKKLIFLIALLIALPTVMAADLSTYPAFFDEVTLVLPDSATSTDIDSRDMVTQALQAEGIATSAQSADQMNAPYGNVISFGTNAVTTDLLTDDTFTIGDGTARIKIFENGEDVQIVIYGNTPEDAQKAAHVLANWKDFPLQTKDIIVGGTLPDLTLSEIVSYVDYSCGDTQTFGWGQPWPEPCISQTPIQYFPDPFAPVVDDTTGDDTTGDDTTGDDTTGDDTTGDDTTGDDTTGDDTTGDDTTGDDDTGNDTTSDPIPGAALSFTGFTLGDSKQDRGETVSQTFVLTNDGTVDLTGFTFSGIASKYNFEIEGFPTSLLVGQTATLTAKSYVPLDQDAVDNKCEATSRSIGTLTINTAEGASNTQNPKMQAVNELRILDVRADLRGDDKRLEGRTTDVYWDEQFDIRVEIQNRFSDDDDIDGQDLSIDVEVEFDGDNEVDVDEDDLEIDADDDGTAVLNARVDSNADGKDRGVIIVQGKDDEGAEHCDQTTVRFNIIEQFLTTPAPVITFTNNDEQTSQPTVQPQEEPREEDVEVITAPAPVTDSKFRNSNGYVGLLIAMIVLMLAVIAAEIALIKRRKTLLTESYDQHYDDQYSQ